ncbi:hypothetical protein Tco_0606172 [Tanacetum coccineum]
MYVASSNLRFEAVTFSFNALGNPPMKASIVFIRIVSSRLFCTRISLDQCSYWDWSAFAMVAACASRAAVIPSVMSCWMAAKVRGYGMIHNDEDGDSDANDRGDDEREISWK